MYSGRQNLYSQLINSHGVYPVSKSIPRITVVNLFKDFLYGMGSGVWTGVWGQQTLGLKHILKAVTLKGLWKSGRECSDVSPGMEESRRQAAKLL